MMVKRSVILPILVFHRFVNAMVYYCVILSSPGLGGDMYLNYTLTSIVEVPAYIACIWLTGR